MRTLHTSSYPQIAVDLKLPMKAEFISRMIVMRAKILENYSANARSWRTMLSGFRPRAQTPLNRAEAQG